MITTEFSSSGIDLYELPNGQQITIDRFSEFQKSLDYYRATKTFEELVRDSVLASNKPTILLEGDTDRDYLITYLNLIGRLDILNAAEIDWAGKMWEEWREAEVKILLIQLPKHLRTNRICLKQSYYLSMIAIVTSLLRA